MGKYNKIVCGFCGRIEYEGSDPQTSLCKGYTDEKAVNSVDLDELTKRRISLSLEKVDQPSFDWQLQIVDSTGIEAPTVAKVCHCESEIHEALNSHYDPCPYRIGELIAELSGIKLEEIFKVLQAEFVMEYEQAEEDIYI